MKVNLEKIDKNKAGLEIEVETEQVTRAMHQAYTKLVKKVNIPGFRKGKAPKSILERYVGKAALLEEAAEIMIVPNYAAAVKETGIEPIDRPAVDIIQLDEEKPFTFKVTVDVKPEVTLGEYKGIQVEKPHYPVAEEDVNKELDRLQQRYAKLIELGEEDEIQKDDIAAIDFQGFVDGQPFEGGAAENYSLGIGSGSFIPGFEDQLIGAKINEERDVQVTFPAEYHKEELAGKEAVFKVKIKGVKRKEVAPLDDEFAKDVSEFESLTDLKADITKRLEESAERRAEEHVKNEVVKKAVDAASVDIPPVMVDQRVERMIDDLSERLRMQGLNLEQYLQFMQSDLEKMKEQYRPQAEQDVKTDLVLEAILKAEGIQASDEEVTSELEKVAQQYNQPVDAVKEALEKAGRLETLEYGITLNKTVDFLVNQSNVA
ncbi:trigger factor [Candidatus Formimonas warabiya]|uniref:Trigger factor n=1 Tax=Formimonas warabiya TaxID=1761012 RepID=A0A3G1KSX3_FORW1|nr:trigger factor [Candidatus Formimonas warabiya]ATW25504.1 trigger factor [Candidatus Formimonas warabiya]